MAHVTAARPVGLTSPPPGVLPRPIRKALGRIDRRLRALSVLRRLGTAGVAGAVVAAAGMAADFAWGLSREARWAVWGAWVVAVGAPLAAGLARGLVRRSRALDLAAVLERGAPALGERLTGAVGLLGTAGGPAHGSPALIAALADDAAARVGAVDPARAAPARAAWGRLALGVLAVGVVAGPSAWRPDPFARLARRFFMPWADLTRVSLYTVHVAPGDAVAALGDDLTISARVAPRFGSTPAKGETWLEWSDEATGRARRRAMPEAEGGGTAPASAGGARAFSVVMPRLAGSFRYRVVNGSGESPYYRVEAVPPPAVLGFKARVEPPSYTKRPAADARDPSRFEAWEDSRVTLTLTANTPLRAAEVSWPRASGGPKAATRAVVASVSADGRTATAVVPAEATGDFTFALRDAHGLRSRPEPPRRVTVRPDLPPVLAVRAGKGPEETRPDDTLRAAVSAGDDVAVVTAELHYEVERAATRPGDTSAEDPSKDRGQAALRLPGLGTASARGEASLPLKPLGLRAGDVLAYRVRVTDNRPAPRGPNVTWSGPRRLTVVAKADPLWARRNSAGRAEVQAKLDALKKAAAENRRETEPLRYAADAVHRGNGAWDADRQQALSRREADARNLVGKLEEFAREVAEEPAFRPLARPARQAAGVEAEAARATLDQARQDEDAGKRLADLRQADARQAAVALRLEEIQRDLNALAEKEADRNRLMALADRQAEVAAKAGKPDDAAPPDRARLDQVAAAQNAVRNELDALLKKSPDLRADVLAAQAEEAEALARRARAVAERQRAEAREATDLSKRARALKALAEEQRAIEDDARRLALDVNPPLTENGRGALNTEPLKQAAPPIERGDLAQGRAQAEAAENELRRAARDLEDLPADPKDLARRLAARQEQITNEVIQALGEARNKGPLPAAEADALAARLKPLADRQKAVAGLAADILKTPQARAKKADPPFPRDAANQAAETTGKAARAVARGNDPRDAEAQAQAARAALQRLANELPDVWKRREAEQRAINEARPHADAAANQVDQHLRETERPNEPGFTAARAAAELAQRLAPTADAAKRAAERLEAAEPPARLRPQHDRAARRARALAEAAEAVRAQAPKDPAAPAGFDPDRARALRDALAAAAADSRQGLARLEQKFQGGNPADDLADELAGEQRALAAGPKAAAAGEGPGAAEPEARGERAAEQRRLASALRGVQAPDAPLAQAEAVRLAERAAEALEHPADPKGAKAEAEALARAAAAAGAFADRLNDRQTPRERAEALARAERGLNDPAAPADPDAEVARHRAVAAELARLAPAGKPGAADPPAEAVRAAADLARRAQGREEPVPGQGLPTTAERAAARAHAAEALDALAAALPASPPKTRAKPAPEGKAPRDPELALEPGQAGKARALALRERRLRERLQSVLGDRVAPQQEVRRESAEVGRELTDLRDRAGALSDRARGPADQAAAMLRDAAPHAMDEAAGQLALGQVAPARDTQRRAADLAERGAQNAEDLAAALRAEATPAGAPAQADAGHEGAEPADADADALAAAREAMAQASRSLGQSRDPAQGRAAFDAARRAMRGAADRLQAAARAKSQAGEPGDPDGALARAPAPADAPPREPRGDRAGVARAESLDDLQALVRRKTGRNWGELPGHLRTEILQMSQGRYRDDYARLIQLYFREIAAGAGADGPERP